MSESKYGHLLKTIPFSGDGPGYYRQVAIMNGGFFGQDVHVEYGTCVAAGHMGQEPYGLKVNDYNEVMVWMGVDDPADMGYLGAEVELCLGEEKERHVIATSTSVAVPAGLPYFPAAVTEMEKRFIFMTISCAAEKKPKLLSADREVGELAGFHGSKYGDYITRQAFKRNGPWHYGPNNRDTHAGAITEIRGKNFEFNMSYESVRKGPYRFGPEPDKMYAHPDFFQFLVYMGIDCTDLSELGAEVEITLGEEMEKHTFSRPTVVAIPQGTPLGHNTILRVEKPFVFCVIRPLSSGESKDRVYLKP